MPSIWLAELVESFFRNLLTAYGKKARQEVSGTYSNGEGGNSIRSCIAFPLARRRLLFSWFIANEVENSFVPMKSNHFFSVLYLLLAKRHIFLLICYIRNDKHRQTSFKMEAEILNDLPA